MGEQTGAEISLEVLEYLTVGTRISNCKVLEYLTVGARISKESIAP